MLRRKKRVVLTVVLVLLLLGFVFYRPNKYGDQVLGEITRVSVILPHKDDNYWDLIDSGIQAAWADIGEENRININTVMPQQNYNIPQMTDLLKQQIAASVDVLVIQGNEDPEFREALLEAYERGILIVCVDTDIQDFPEHLYIGTDNYAAGRMLGEALVDMTDGKAEAVVISGEPEYLNLQQRLSGLQDVVIDYPGIHLSQPYYDHYDGITVMELYRKLQGKEKTLIYLEGTGGNTLIKQFSERDDTYQYILGCDIVEGPARGILDGVVLQNTFQMGYRAVEEIISYVNTGSYSSDRIYTDIYWVTKENYRSILEKKGLEWLKERQEGDAVGGRK